ncbi:MAG TPA: GDP-mannose 4,6-dehydratase, partial [Flexistipes sinusarabici]|nr:GDP-mannose 4,6-dehydratase [Flexistipes sinusarabici]
ISLHPGDIVNYPRLVEILDEVKPDEIYHLAAQSFVHESFEDAFTTFRINIDGTLNVLSAMKAKVPDAKFYFAGSSEMFGKVEETPQNENTKFHPRSPYGVSKVTGYELTRNFREAYGMFCSSGILFNHESPRRGFEFVTRKITSGIGKIKAGKTNCLILGNIDAKRDWGFAGDYVEAMWLMLQQNRPDDYVVSTNEAHSIREFMDIAFQIAGMDYKIVDLHNLSIEEANDKIKKLESCKGVYVVQHPLFYRPSEVDLLIGESSKARNSLPWKPQISFQKLVEMMICNDIKYDNL